MRHNNHLNIQKYKVFIIFSLRNTDDIDYNNHSNVAAFRMQGK